MEDMKTICSTPEWKNKVRAGQKRVWADSKYRSREKKRRRTPEFRAMMSSAAKKALASPEVRQRIREGLARVDPAVWEKRAKAVSASAQRPEVKRKRSIAAKKMWRNPVHRVKIVNALTGGKRTLEQKNRMSVAARKRVARYGR